MGSIFMQTPYNFRPIPSKHGIIRMAGQPVGLYEELGKSLCAQLKECGFNAAGGYVRQDKIESSLINCQNNNLTLYLHNNSDLNYDMQAMLNLCAKNPAFGGWILSLNVTETDFEDPMLRFLYNSLTSVWSTHNVVMGFSGDWNLEGNKNFQTFPDYVAQYQSLYQPAIWPISYFPDLKDNKTGKVPPGRIGMFYKTLQYMAYVARYTATPLWYICRCQAFSNYKGYDAPPVTLQLMRGVLFTALSYGAQGIYYWNYRQNDNQGNTTFSDAPVHSDKTKNTAIWDIIQQINKEIKGYEEVFSGCEWIDTRFTLPPDTTYLKKNDYPIGPMLSITGKSMIFTNFIISHIFNKGKNYLVIIRDPLSSLTSLRPILSSDIDPLPNPDMPILEERIKFSEYWDIYQLKLNDGVLTEERLTDYNFSLADYSLSGDYLIFRWE